MCLWGFAFYFNAFSSLVGCGVDLKRLKGVFLLLGWWELFGVLGDICRSVGELCCWMVVFRFLQVF